MFIVKAITDHKIINLITKNEVGFIGTELLSFDIDDIIDYYRINELVITREEALSIYNKTYGWPYAVEIYMKIIICPIII